MKNSNPRIRTLIAVARRVAARHYRPYWTVDREDVVQYILQVFCERGLCDGGTEEGTLHAVALFAVLELRRRFDPLKRTGRARATRLATVSRKAALLGAEPIPSEEAKALGTSVDRLAFELAVISTRQIDGPRGDEATLGAADDRPDPIRTALDKERVVVVTEEIAAMSTDAQVALRSVLAKYRAIDAEKEAGRRRQDDPDLSAAENGAMTQLRARIRRRFKDAP